MMGEMEAFKELCERSTARPYRTEHSLTRGYTVWGAFSSTSSMQIAATGHAGFDLSNAKFLTLAANHVEALVKMVDRLTDDCSPGTLRLTRSSKILKSLLFCRIQSNPCAFQYLCGSLPCAVTFSRNEFAGDREEVSGQLSVLAC